MQWTDYLPLFMFLALGLLLFTGYPVAFVLAGVGLAFGFIGIVFDLFAPVEFFNIVPRIWGGLAENLVLTAVPMFIFMGVAMERSGVTREMLRCLQVLLRRVPGGLALAVTVIGTLLAATTGIIGASIVMLTLLALPVMLQQHYNPEFATGTIAASGVLGILIPPSIMLIIMADLLAISVGILFVAALLPGLLLSLLYLLYILTMGYAKPRLAPPLSESEAPSSLTEIGVLVGRSLLPPVILIVLVLGSIFAGWATPTEAAGVGAGGALLLAALNRRLTFTALHAMVQRTALTGAMIFFIFIGATAFSYVFRSLGGDDLITGLVQALGWESWGLLFVLMVIVFALGFFLDWIEITLILLPVFSPIVELMDFGNHVASGDIVYWFAVLVAVNLQTAFLTPPFGPALFYMKGIAGASLPLRRIYRGIVPFVALQLVGLCLVIAFPQIAMWLPQVVYG